MKAGTLLSFMLFAMWLPFAALSQNHNRDDIYTNKNPRDYYDDKTRRYDDEEENGEEPEERRYDDEDSYGKTKEDDEEVYAERQPRDSRRNEPAYVCRPRHHYNCRHDRYQKRPRSYWFPGGQVIVNSGRHGYVRTKVWVPGHWEHSPGGHRYWIPGHYKYERVRW
jgi:hypothetical protein